MGIPVALHGFGGGGGASLNFKVVGGLTQPADPSENTIWVNTDVDITSYDFTPVEPEAPEGGMVWVLTGTSSTIAFNALKKNGIQIYPISAKQYVDGAWVAVTAKSYQDGEWVDWMLYLYNSGDECSALTGGWTSYAYKNSSSGSTVRALSVTKNTDSITITQQRTNPTGAFYAGSLFTENKFDLTQREAIGINLTEFSSASPTDRVAFALSATKANNFEYAAKIDMYAPGTYSIDISELSGEYYALFIIAGCEATTTATFDKVYAK